MHEGRSREVDSFADLPCSNADDPPDPRRAEVDLGGMLARGPLCGVRQFVYYSPLLQVRLITGALLTILGFVQYRNSLDPSSFIIYES